MSHRMRLLHYLASEYFAPVDMEFLVNLWADDGNSPVVNEARV